MVHPLERLISEGESIHQDFKFRIDDSRKIAKTVSAFANTDGGRLLIGVKDNGKVAGISVEEEYYMVKAAAEMYNKPVVEFETQLWDYHGRSVLEMKVPPSDNKPHLAKGEDGIWLAYIRIADVTCPASIVHIELWRDSGHISKSPPREFAAPEAKILELLKEKGALSISQLTKRSKIPRRRVIDGLTSLVKWELVDINNSEDRYLFSIHLADSTIPTGQ